MGVYLARLLEIIFEIFFAMCLKVALLRRVLGGFGGDRCGFEGFVVWWRVFGVSFVGALMVIFFLSVGRDGIVWGVAFGN